jgi:predicted RNA-binding Zn ribbon-like protein
MTPELMLGAAGSLVSLLLGGYVVLLRFTLTQQLVRIDALEKSARSLEIANALADQRGTHLTAALDELKAAMRDLKSTIDRHFQGRQSTTTE